MMMTPLIKNMGPEQNISRRSCRPPVNFRRNRRIHKALDVRSKSRNVTTANGIFASTYFRCPLWSAHSHWKIGNDLFAAASELAEEVAKILTISDCFRWMRSSRQEI